MPELRYSVNVARPLSACWEWLQTDGVIRGVACPACLGQDIARHLPRVVPATFPRPFLLYTDGACEVGPTGIVKASVGAVLVNETGQMCRHFWSDVPSAVLESLGLRSQRQVVGQAELFPVWIATMAWRGDLVADQSSHSLTTTHLAIHSSQATHLQLLHPASLLVRRPWTDV